MIDTVDGIVDELAWPEIPSASPGRQFVDDGYLPLRGFLSPSALEAMKKEVEVLQQRAKRRDFAMECMGGTPRHMTTLGGIEIAEHGPLIARLYEHHGLLSHIGSQLAMQIRTADDPIERHVLNILHKRGDTHGLHVDDYPIALVMFLESPACTEGCGHLQYHPADTPEQVSSHGHAPGDAYLLRSDRFAHRVMPIHDGCTRTVLNFAYGADGVDVNVSPSASLLYS